MTALNISTTGATAQSKAIDNIANNIANVNTISFKKGFIATTDLPYITERRYGGAVNVNSNVIVPTGIQYGSGTAVSAIIRDQKGGDAIQTGNQLDIRIDGIGYFALNMPDGSQSFTRDGRFQIDPNTNQIVTNAGYSVSPGINIPTNRKSISIRSDGTVMVILPGSEILEEIGQLDIVSFINPAGLEMTGDNLYLATDASGDPQFGTPDQDIYGKMIGGWLEGSNVNPIIEMTDLLKSQRAYEMNIKVISAVDEMDQKLYNV